MNTISAFKPNYYQNNVNKQQSQNIQFKGIGKEYANKIANGNRIKSEVILNNISRGFFGLKTENVTEIMDSFIEKIRNLAAEKEFYINELVKSEAKANRLMSEKYEAISDLKKVINKKNEEIAKMKAELEKYQTQA